jgi:hypothetical protein
MLPAGQYVVTNQGTSIPTDIIFSRVNVVAGRTVHLNVLDRCR